MNRNNSSILSFSPPITPFEGWLRRENELFKASFEGRPSSEKTFREADKTLMSSRYAVFLQLTGFPRSRE
jgi:hypothetical protein